jgi:hypothetical protein
MARGQKIAVIWSLALLVLGLVSANGAASRDPVSLSAIAPADEYFGRQKLSPIGIRHKIFSLKDDLHHARAHPDSIQREAQLLEDALHDWTTRFPQDPWLPSAAWNLATLYEELPGTDAQNHAVSALHFIVNAFAGSQYAQLASRDLTRGVGVRPWPHWAGPSPQPSTTTSASTAPSPSASPQAVSAQPSPVVAETPDDAKSLVGTILAQKDLSAAEAVEKRYWVLSKDGSDADYVRAAWELAALYERLPGEESRQHAIRMMALLVDRYPQAVYGRWAMRDLERGIGAR